LNPEIKGKKQTNPQAVDLFGEEVSDLSGDDDDENDQESRSRNETRRSDESDKDENEGSQLQDSTNKNFMVNTNFITFEKHGLEYLKPF
jgi:hypothetical protein